MRPLQLSIRAFGPYADPVELDFRELESRSLFLIHGPTGAGKTTILDAMCFALFGEASGVDRKGKDTRSHFADPSQPTSVTMEFLLGADRWRVTRTAEQARPGGGATMKPAQASLESIGEDGTATLRASKVGDVNAEVNRILGFKVDQFRQVVLLPQGEFRRLLVSDSKDREKILETLFGVELYRRIEFELGRASTALKREVADDRTRIDALLGGCEAESVEALEKRADEQTARGAELTTRTQSLRQQAALAAQQLGAAKTAAAAFAEHGVATARLEVLESESVSWARRREELAAARRALGLEALAERLRNTKATLQREEGKQAAAVAALTQNRAEEIAAAAALEKAETGAAAREEAEARCRFLHQAKDAAVRLRKLREEIAAAEVRLADQTGAVSLNDRDIAYALGRIDAADKELESLRPIAARASSCSDRVKRARAVLESTRALEAQRSFLLRQSVTLGGARQRLAEAETDVATAQARESDLLRRWSEGQAARLARELAAGSACPVCGSADHPRPAPWCDDIPTQENLDEARAAIGDAARQVDARRKEVEKEKAKEENLQRQKAELEGALGEEREISFEDAAAATALLEAELVEAGKAHARAFDLEGLKKKEQAALAEAQASRNEAVAGAAKEDKTLARDRGLAEEVSKAVPADVAAGNVDQMLKQAVDHAAALRESFESVKAGHATSRAALAAATTNLERAQVSAAEAASAVEVATNDLAVALASTGFVSAQEFEAARRPTAEIDSLEANLRRFDETLAAARERSARATTATASLAPPNLEEKQQADTQAQSALELALAEHSRVEEALTATRRTLLAVGESASRITGAETRYLAVGKVADVVSGTNREGISFARFVLGSLLDDVLAAATERLLRMSQGRFELSRAGGRRDRRRSGGLDLEVFDSHTGVARPAATLSGGEGFLASLSLALGLADVVQSHTGGIHLETMFIDEGFGTLDPEALDLAMRALEDLQQGGRLVGIISHVPELKERVGARLEVTAGRRGSSARFVL